MIARITGNVEEVSTTSALIALGDGLCYELLIPACEVERLSRKLGQQVVLHTLHYIEGDPAHGALTPRLIGFVAEEDREFFRLVTTVKGIGMRKALRALARPISQVAAAIQNKDAAFLKGLPEIGARMAERIITELHGKIDTFAGPSDGEQPADLTDAAKEAISALVMLGEKRAEAAGLVERALAVEPDADSPEDIITIVYKIRAGGAG